MSPGVGSTIRMYAASGDRGADGTLAANRGSLARPFTPSKLGDGHSGQGHWSRLDHLSSPVMVLAFANNALVTVVNPSQLEGRASRVHPFCDHVELLIRARVYDAEIFTLLTDPPSIMAIGLRFMTSKVMERMPVPDWKTGWEVSTILEALRQLSSCGT